MSPNLTIFPGTEAQSLRGYSQRKEYNYFFLGLILIELFNSLYSLFVYPSMRVPSTIGLILVILSTQYILKNKFNINTPTLIKVYIIWNVITCLRLEELTLDELRLSIFQQKHLFSYLVPLVVFFPIQLSFIRKIFQFSIILCFISVLLYLFLSYFSSAVSDRSADMIISTFLPGAEILTLTYIYQKRKIRYLSISTLVFAIITGAMAGRRSIIISGTLFLVARIIFDIKFTKNLSKKNILTIVSLSLAILLFLSFDSIVNNFDALQSRVYTDSRTSVYVSFLNDMNGLDWIIGRGIDGKYFNPMIYWSLIDDTSREVVYRDNIENGFLYHILKGGLISLVLFLLISLKAIYLGLYKSQNILSKAFSVYILIYVFQMISFGQPSLSIKYIFVWLCITFCYSNKVRNISEKTLREHLRI